MSKLNPLSNRPLLADELKDLVAAIDGLNLWTRHADSDARYVPSVPRSWLRQQFGSVIDVLPVLDTADVSAWAPNGDLDDVDFCHALVYQYFLFILPDGAWLLVDTGGSNYMKFVCRIAADF